MSDKPLKHPREVPNSFLDLSLMTTNTLWGTDYVSPELRKHLTKSFYKVDAEGNVIVGEDGRPLIDTKAIWHNFSIYTRDLRLGNLSYKNNEIPYCQHYIDLASDLLNFGFREPVAVAMTRAVTVIETSQSKGGFVRRQMNTVRQEHSQELLEPEKKGFWGGSK